MLYGCLPCCCRRGGSLCLLQQKNRSWVPFNSQLVLVGIYGRREGWNHWGGEKKILFRALVFTCHFLCAINGTQNCSCSSFCPCFISFLKGHPCLALRLNSPACSAGRAQLARVGPDPESRQLFQSGGCSASPLRQTAAPGQGHHRLINLMCNKPGKRAECCGQEGWHVRLSNGAVTSLRKFVSVELDSSRTWGVCAAAGGRQRPLARPWVSQGLLLALGFGCSQLWTQKHNKKKIRNNHMCPHGQKLEGGKSQLFLVVSSLVA